MRTRSYFNYSDHDLMCRLKVLVADDRSVTVELVACIAEVEKRGLFRPAGYDSMHAYCLHELHLCDDAAFKRIRAARAAFPARTRSTEGYLRHMGHRTRRGVFTHCHVNWFRNQ
jgi:hypothetical protein